MPVKEYKSNYPTKKETKKINLPTTWTKKKMTSLLLIGWLSVNGVEAGQTFKNCLAYNHYDTVYNSLLNYPFNSDTIVNSGGKLQLCCGRSFQCSSATQCNSSNNNFILFACNKINQKITCIGVSVNGTTPICGGIVGDMVINSNYSAGVGACPDINSIANYLTVSDDVNKNTNNGYSFLACPTGSPCENFDCAWDNGGWTCFPDFGNILDNATCYLQFPAPFPGSTASSNTPNSSVNNSISVLPKVIIPVVTTTGVITIGGAIYYCYKKSKKKSENRTQIVLNKGDKVKTQTVESDLRPSNIKNILLIGSTGKGKSALANVITGMENKFKESSGSTSETREIQKEEFFESDINYSVIDTVGVGDTKLKKEEVLDKIAEAVYSIKDGVNQVLFVIGNKFDQREMENYDLLRTIIFDDEVVEHTTIIRTRFKDFENPKKCQEDIDLMIKEGGKLAEIIKSCRKVIHVNNPSLNLDSNDDENEYEKEKREEKIASRKKIRSSSRKIILDHLHSNCQGTSYKPSKLKELEENIRQGVLRHILNNYEEVKKILGGDNFIAKILGDDQEIKKLKEKLKESKQPELIEQIEVITNNQD